MSRFLERQLKSAEEKKLGRREHFWEYDEKTGRENYGVRATDQAKTPRMVTAAEYPVGRPSGVAKPGTENTVGRARSYASTAIAIPATTKKKKR